MDCSGIQAMSLGTFSFYGGFFMYRFSAVVATLVLSSTTFAQSSHMHHSEHHMDHSAHHMNHEETHHHAMKSMDSASKLEFDQCWARFRPDNASAIYLDIHNKDTTKEAHIVGVSSPAFKSLMIHQSKEENGMMRMEHTDSLSIPAQEVLKLAPGGYHIMAFEPQHIQVGDKIDLSFVLSNGQTLTTTCTMKKFSAKGFND